MPQYNGNIASQYFVNAGANTFSYTYDALNRLINASAGNSLGEAISYDVMGKIAALTREGAGNGTISYSYNTTNGNRLNSISGFSTAVTIMMRMVTCVMTVAIDQ